MSNSYFWKGSIKKKLEESWKKNASLQKFNTKLWSFPAIWRFLKLDPESILYSWSVLVAI